MGKWPVGRLGKKAADGHGTYRSSSSCLFFVRLCIGGSSRSQERLLFLSHSRVANRSACGVFAYFCCVCVQQPSRDAATRTFSGASFGSAARVCVCVCVPRWFPGARAIAALAWAMWSKDLGDDFFFRRLVATLRGGEGFGRFEENVVGGWKGLWAVGVADEEGCLSRESR